MKLTQKQIKQIIKEELNKILDEITYSKLMEADKAMTENAKEIVADTPMGIFVG